MQPDPQVVLTKHSWTEISIVPVEVLPDLDREGLPIVLRLVEPEAHIGCEECLEPLTPDNITAECEGDTGNALP